MTVQDLINIAMRDMGVLAQGETPNADESADGLSTLNHILSNWSTEGLTAYALRAETFPLVAADPTYSMGPAGDFNTTRPTQIVAARASIGNYGRGLKIIGPVEWSAIVERGGAVNLPSKLYIDYDYPLAKVYVWPAPLVAATIEIHSVEQFGIADDAGQIAPSSVKRTQTFALTPNVTAYTLGPGGSMAGSRPSRIIAAAAYTAAYRRALDIVPAQEWSTNLEAPNLGVSIPISLYPQYGHPLATINVWPVPSAGVSLELHSLQQFTAFATLGENISMPTGYEAALRWALATMWASSFGRPVTEEMAAMAQSTKRAVQELNASILGMTVAPAPPAPAAPQQ